MKLRQRSPATQTNSLLLTQSKTILDLDKNVRMQKSERKAQRRREKLFFFLLLFDIPAKTIMNMRRQRSFAAASCCLGKACSTSAATHPLQLQVLLFPCVFFTRLGGDVQHPPTFSMWRDVVGMCVISVMERGGMKCDP